MNYLLSFKPNKDAKPSHQMVEDEEYTLNLVRFVILQLQSMEETSADLKAIKFMQEVTKGNAKVLEGSANSRVLVVQVHNDID